MDYDNILTIAIGVCYFLSHTVQYLPTSWTEKIPDAVMQIINLIGAKHGSENAAKTDMKGNSIE